MRRSDAVRLVTGAAAALLAGCDSTDACFPVPVSTGSASKPTRLGVTLYSEDPVSRDISLVTGFGGTLLRAGVEFGSYTYLDALLPAAAQEGMRVVLISPYANQPVDVASYASGCAATHQRYARYNPIWELWNEPNLGYYWGASPNVNAYTTLAIATAKALRASGATDVWSGGTSGIDYQWIKQMMALGAYQVMNGCAVHTYEQPCAMEDQYFQLLGLLAPAGIPIHTTETCIPSTQDQVAFLQQLWYIHRKFGMPTMIWCELRDGTAGSHGPYTYPYGLVTSNYTPKPSYYAAKGLTASSPVVQFFVRKR
jgi:hypothetical protein